MSRGCSPKYSKTFYICFKSGEKSLRAGKTVTLYPALTWSPLQEREKSHTFYPKHEWFAVNKVKNKK